MMVIRDPEAIQLIADETRRKIVFLLRVKEMTVAQIAAELNLTPQAVYHHVKKLLDGRMIEVVREERVGHLIESYYRATAEAFSFSFGKTPGGRKLAREQVVTILNALKKLGFNLEFDEKKISQLIDIWTELNDCCKSSGKFEDAVAELDDVDFITKQAVQEYAEILSMSNEEFTKQQKIRNKFRDFLTSLIKK